MMPVSCHRCSTLMLRPQRLFTNVSQATASVRYAKNLSSTAAQTNTSPPPDSASPRRVVVTAVGAVTPLGKDVASSWKALISGRSGITAVPTGGGYDGIPSQIGMCACMRVCGSKLIVTERIPANLICVIVTPSQLSQLRHPQLHLSRRARFTRTVSVLRTGTMGL